MESNIMTRKQYIQDLENSDVYGIFTCAKEEFCNESNIMTRKQYLQDLENSVAYGIFTCAKQEFCNEGYHASMRLRTCQAVVYSTDNFYLLKSYETFVAAIEKRTGKIADVLRGEYHYTATSAQHISKFIHDYTSYPHNNERYTYCNI